MTVRELALKLGLAYEGDGDAVLESAAPVEEADSRDIAFAGPKVFVQATASHAGCIITTLEYERLPSQNVIRAADPRTAFAGALRLLFPPERVTPGIHPTAVIAATAQVDSASEIGAFVTVGDHAVIEPNCRIEAGCHIGANVRIGSGSHLRPGVTIYPRVSVGRNAILHSGVVIGADGFGFARTGDRYEKFPQVGTVVIEDNVEIGANSCVDRAALGTTFIGQGTKLDNMVHIGHNCRIGRHVLIAAQTGLAGGVVVEDYAIIGGQVGIGDKARIKSGAILGSGSGVLTSKIVRAEGPMWGTPARPLKQHLESLANIQRIPALRAQLQELRRRLEELEQQEEP